MEYYSEFLWERNDREVNEDSLAINQVVLGNKTLLMAVICDGIGSLPDGEIAASYVVGCMKSMFEGIRKDRIPKLKRLKNAIGFRLYSCHETLKEKGIGTTVCIAVIYDRKCLLIHTGDSRIYMGKDKMKPVGEDHSDASKRLTRAIGIGDYRKMDYCIKHLSKKSRILLCSDGFYRRNDKAIRSRSCFKEHVTEEERFLELKEMYDRAKALGEKDNSSAIIIWSEEKHSKNAERRVYGK